MREKTKLKEEFIKEYFRKAKADGYEVNGQMFLQMEKDLYIEWLEENLNSMREAVVKIHSLARDADEYRAVSEIDDICEAIKEIKNDN